MKKKMNKKHAKGNVCQSLKRTLWENSILTSKQKKPNITVQIALQWFQGVPFSPVSITSPLVCNAD